MRRRKLKVGDVLWRMAPGAPNPDGTERMYAMPICIEYADDYTFLDGKNVGGSWNSIGVYFFLTRKECLRDYELRGALPV